MTNSYSSGHADFRLNGNSYSESELKALAYDLIKEGEPFEQSIGDFLTYWFDEKTTLEVKTSGSTGTPKSIVLQKQQMVNSALATGFFFNLEAGHTALLCLPTNYIAGKMMLVRALVLGLHLDYVAPASNPLTGIKKHYDFAAMVPLQLDHAIDQIDLVKVLLVGGAPVSNVLKEKVQHKRTGIFETYGMTETITHIAVKRINRPQKTSAANYFSALPDVTLSKDDRDCLVINAPKVSNQLIITNDVVDLISAKQFKWLGRYDSIINSGGIKIMPEQVEAKLATILKNRFFIAGELDEKLGQKVVLVVEGEIDQPELLLKINRLSTLEKFEIPKQLYNVPKFIETPTGKIDRIKIMKAL